MGHRPAGHRSAGRRPAADHDGARPSSGASSPEPRRTWPAPSCCVGWPGSARPAPSCAKPSSPRTSRPTSPTRCSTGSRRSASSTTPPSPGSGCAPPPRQGPVPARAGRRAAPQGRRRRRPTRRSTSWTTTTSGPRPRPLVARKLREHPGPRPREAGQPPGGHARPQGLRTRSRRRGRPGSAGRRGRDADTDDGAGRPHRARDPSGAPPSSRPVAPAGRPCASAWSGAVGVLAAGRPPLPRAVPSCLLRARGQPAQQRRLMMMKMQRDDRVGLHRVVEVALDVSPRPSSSGQPCRRTRPARCP